MSKSKPRSDAGQPDSLSDALVALYLTEETGLPCNTKDYEISLYKAPDSAGILVERRALRVTFKKDASTKRQLHLLTFGSHDRSCNVILMATEASPVHCKIFAQLNSGPNIWVIEDSSSDGTEYLDDESLLNGIPKRVVRCRVAAHGLRRIKIGRNIFSFWPPSDRKEMSQREHWFQSLDPILVTQDLLLEQLGGAMEDYRPICPIGHGGMGDVIKYMELTTGLMVAVKEEEVKKEGADERIQKEIAYMQNLRHPNLVGYIMSNSVTTGGVKKWFTAMPLYQGRLCDILPLSMSAIEEVMLQLFDGVNYMHAQRVLHKDIKPENILVKGKSRPDVVLADYGICASLINRAELMGPSGTRGFAAPEVSRMIVQTPAVDVFALGATFFYIMEPERCNGPYATVATLENVMQRPPKVYGGLVQCMMARHAEERPSLIKCFEIVRARQRDWKKRVPLALLPSPVPSAFSPRRSHRLQKAVVHEPSIRDPAWFPALKPRLAPIAQGREPPTIDPARFAARRPRLAPVAQGRKSPALNPAPLFAARKPRLELVAQNREPQKRLGLQQAPLGLCRVWDQVGKFHPPITPFHEPQAPAPAQRVDFSVRPPPASTNPFAFLDRDPAPNMAPPARQQPTPAVHEPARTPIRKPDNDIKRRIRRGPERRKMIERWHSIRVQKNKLCDAAGELASGTPLNIVRGLRDLTEGGFCFTGQYLGLIFSDLAAAMPALQHIAPKTGRWGLNTNKRLMYGLKSTGVWPMTPEEYERERLLSELNGQNTTEGRRGQREGEERERRGIGGGR